MRRRIHTDDGARAFGKILVKIRRENTKPKRQARAAEFLDPYPHANILNAHDRPQIINRISPDKMKLIRVFLRIKHATPAEVFPERANGALEEKKVSRIVEDLKGVEVVEIHAHQGLMEP